MKALISRFEHPAERLFIRFCVYILIPVLIAIDVIIKGHL